MPTECCPLCYGARSPGLPTPSDPQTPRDDLVKCPVEVLHREDVADPPDSRALSLPL